MTTFKCLAPSIAIGFALGLIASISPLTLVITYGGLSLTIVATCLLDQRIRAWRAARRAKLLSTKR